MKGPVYISVILPLRLEWEPCYSLPDGTDESMMTVGDRVKVPFSGKTYSGVVSAIGITPETAASKIKEIIEIEEGLEKVLPEEISLWRSVAGYYLCTIGEVYKAAYPASKINLEEARATALAKARERREKLLDSMRTRIGRMEQRLQKKLEMAEKAKPGTKAKIQHTEGAERIRTELDNAIKVLKEAYEGNEPSGNARNKGIFTSPCDIGITLNEAQDKAYGTISEAFGRSKPVLLHGITGSGKTEIYIKLAQEALNSGKNVLYLVPEIALSRQLEERLRKHFGERLMTFHSAESAVSKRTTAETIRAYRNTADSYIVLGTRSSLFLPHHTLGLIIVDEEHDSSYKQDSPAPRYNGRDTALMLSVIHKCNIILGSATPSLEELYNCRCGKHVKAEINERFHGSLESDIEIIDTKAERRKRGMHGSFSRKLIEHMKRTMSEGGQVMILRSRRAWAPALQCDECGDIPKCTRCNVSLSYHKTATGGRMVCHYCGYSTTYTGSCQKCNGNIKSLGAGTQKIEEEAAALFPDASIARLDSDTAQNKTYEAQTIKDFAEGKINILIGTQMLSKGFDFSNLNLVAVIAADTMLGLQDFRADEKAVQLLEQFRGRCGRRNNKGLFVIQTSQPEHPIYQRIASNETARFNESLLMEREEFNFPPYSRIIEITIRDRFADRAQRMASMMADKIRNRLGNAQVTGPYTPVIDKIDECHIRTLRVNLKKDRNLKPGKDSIMEIVRKVEKDHKYADHIVINVDPV